jgi:thioredoxin-dependent peroxiredoxin
VAYFTASCDTPELNKKFAEELKLDYPILSDPDRKVAKAYGLVDKDDGYPKRWTMFIDKDGVLKHIVKEVNTAKHGDEIVKKLEEMGVAKAKK